MTIEDCIHKLDFSIGAYQKLIDENVSNGEVVGTGVRGTWTASTPPNKAYSDMIEALQTAKDTMHKYQKIDWITEAWDDDENAMILVHKIREVIEDGNEYRCLFCDAKKGDSPTKPLFFQTLNGGVFGPVILSIDIYDDAIVSIGLCDEVVGNVKINYCPVCGRKLKGGSR